MQVCSCEFVLARRLTDAPLAHVCFPLTLLFWHMPTVIHDRLDLKYPESLGWVLSNRLSTFLGVLPSMLASS